MSALGGTNGDEAGGIFLLDCETFDPLGAWEVEKDGQRFAYDFWWHLGFGIAAREPHPRSGPLTGGPQMVEVSRDGKRIYVSNSLYSSWDTQFYPEGLEGWIAKLDVGPDGGMQLDEELFVTEFDGRLPHQIRLGGGDSPSDSYCFP